jgi:hypothetical protein
MQHGRKERGFGNAPANLLRSDMPDTEDSMIRKSGVVYSSGLTINNAPLLATLAVLYPAVHLPHMGCDLSETAYGKSVKDWERQWEPLFQERVFERLPPPPISMEQVSASMMKLSDAIQHSKHWEPLPRPETGEGKSHIFLSFVVQVANHLSRTDIYLPRVFDAQAKPTRDALVALEAFTVFKYLLPRLNALSPDDILELRHRLRDTREGFAMHLQKLSKAMDSLVASGEKLKDINAHAQALIETDLIPDYREFQRQLEAEQARKVRKVLDLTGKIMEIDAAPWTPKFWGLFLKALGMSAIQSAADQKEHLTNRYQAYEFMKEIDDLGQSKI